MADSTGEGWSSIGKSTLGKAKRKFLTRTATDDAEQLLRRASVPNLGQQVQAEDEQSSKPAARSTAVDALTQAYDESSRDRAKRRAEAEAQATTGFWQRRKSSQSPSKHAPKKAEKVKPRGEAVLRPVGGTDKLGTFSGVFVPTSLNVLSILMFIRFGFVLGQSGLLGALIMLVAAYLINLFTTLSISAVASNGTVRGGGAYYLISRSLGPEFGGSIGIVSYLGFVFNTGMNAVGLVDCLTYNFGSREGIWSRWMMEGGWWQYLWSTVVVLVCVAVCLAGSAIFARASNGLLVILMVSIISIPVSAVLRSPFKITHGSQFTDFTGPSLTTLRQNLFPHLTKGAAGSQVKGRETYQDLFGILFPATGGIFAGASMSGDLKNPSKSIPSGTLYGILLTFISYTLVIISMAASITRATMYRNVNVVQDVNLSGILILLGEISTCLFSVLMGIVGPAKQLQAIARDGIFPGLKIFGQGTQKSDEPIYAILLTWILAQFTILFDINSIASLVTMSYLMMSLSLHLACLLLKLSSAPNFRPSFHFFNQWTAMAGAILSVASMFFVDGRAATGCIAILTFIFLIIHYTTPPKSWGSDVTAGLVYHQVRKYLLRLKTEHVKYWRPQILLFVNDPRRGHRLIQFANSLKKGGLFILGHVIVTENFGASVPEARRQQSAWMKYIEYMKIKSFVNVAISPSIEWGSRNILLSAGLGGMRPNIVMMGFYNLQQFRQEQPLIDVPSPPPERKRKSNRKKSFGDVKGSLPTDICYVEKRTDMQSYILVLEDMILKLQTNVAVAVGFRDLELPNVKEGNSRKYIDLWPIQMSAEIASSGDGQSQSMLTTNFDTYTLILQLGCILNTVRAWKKCFKLRVAVFVEYESDVEEERSRVQGLLDSLRIEAEILVFWLACGDIKSYELIVNGKDVDAESEEQINKVLEDEAWWGDVCRLRGKIKSGDVSASEALSLAEEGQQWQNSSSFSRGREGSVVQLDGLRRMLQERRHRPRFGHLSRMGISLNIRTHKLDDDLISRHASHHSGSEYSGSEAESDGSVHAEGGSEYPDYPSDEVFEDSSDQEDSGDTNQSLDKDKSKTSSSKKSSRASSSKSKNSKQQRRSPRASLLEGKTSFSTPDYAPSSGYNADNDGSEGRGRRLERGEGEEQQAQDDASIDQILMSVAGSNRSRATSPNFTSSPVPATKIANEEGQGPSIMFADDPHPRRQQTVSEVRGEANMRSIYQRTSDDARDGTPKPSTAGFPSAGSVPLSFNDLPSRAQHVILNELMSQNSDETAVTFTTLPAPEEGTFKNESDSLTYLTDLEVLTQGIGPVLLVHSNSMTVTTNL